MSLVVKIIDTKDKSAWFDFKGKDGGILARFKVKNSRNDMYLVASDRVNDRIITDGFSIKNITKDSERFLSLRQDAISHFLIEDWEGISFAEVDGDNPEVVEVDYTPQNAKRLLSMGDMGMSIMFFIEDKAAELQKSIDEEQLEILGKLDSSTNGQNTEATKQPKATQESK